MEVLKKLKSEVQIQDKFQEQWKRLIERLDKKMTDKPINLDKPTFLYDEGWVLEKDFKTQEDLVEYCLFIDKTFLGNIILTTDMLVTVIEGAEKEKERFGGILNEIVAKILRTKFGESRRNFEVWFEQSNVVFPPGGIWSTTPSDVGSLSEEQLGKVKESAKKQLEAMRQYRDAPHWSHSKAATETWSFIPISVLDIQIPKKTGGK